jgi:cephalosporin hydroxylase
MNFIEFKNKYCPETPKVIGEPKIEGWNSQSVALSKVIAEFQPKSIVEVGTWLGASALFMASQSEANIICIDTYLASNEILWRQNNVTNLVNDFSKIYNQFCINISSTNLNDRISPLPMTSSSAAELFQNERVMIDMVYIDAGHREREVYADLQDWWPLANQVVIGDDYNSAWSGVISAADRFSSENNINIEIVDSKFILRH